jgi:hypothetical protein
MINDFKEDSNKQMSEGKKSTQAWMRNSATWIANSKDKEIMKITWNEIKEKRVKGWEIFLKVNNTPLKILVECITNRLNLAGERISGVKDEVQESLHLTAVKKKN